MPAGLLKKSNRTRRPPHSTESGGASDVAIAQVGYTGTDDDRDRWLAAGLWLRRNDDPLYRRIREEQKNRCLREDVIDLNGSPPRDFLAERCLYDVVITHNLWSFPGPSTADDRGPTACSPLHDAAEWKRRLSISRAQYILMFGGDFDGSYLDALVPGYECFTVPAASFLSVFVARERRRNLAAPTQPITYREMTKERLRALPELLMNQSLDLSYTNVDKESLAYLGRMIHLKDLRLVGTPISDADLDHALQRGGLEKLNLDETRISNAGLVHVRKLSQLKCLSLNHTRIDNAGLHYLGGLANLEWLSLVGTGIGDRGIDHLRTIKSLRSLSLVHTAVTSSGLEKLQNAIPECTIDCVLG